MSSFKPLEWKNEVLVLIDQRKLPHVENYVSISTIEQCHWAIKEMLVRGAPMIGFSGIFGLALWIKKQKVLSHSSLRQAANYLISARPTAVNLSYEVNRMVDLLETRADFNSQAWYEVVVNEGLKACHQIYDSNLTMAKLAQEYLDEHIAKPRYRILTHCNTGKLACGPLGTALGVISYLHQQGKIENVFVDETRPYMQGSRLSAYELACEGIAHQIVVEGAASYLMEQKMVDAIFVGADRIASNGDTANKIGTSTLAIVAQFYNIPFFVVAPTSSFDVSLDSGRSIDIELRSSKEILEFQGKQVAPLGSQAFNPSFDITQSRLITGIICEKAMILNPYWSKIKQFASHDQRN